MTDTNPNLQALLENWLDRNKQKYGRYWHYLRKPNKNRLTQMQTKMKKHGNYFGAEYDAEGRLLPTAVKEGTTDGEIGPQAASPQGEPEAGSDQSKIPRVKFGLEYGIRRPPEFLIDRKKWYRKGRSWQQDFCNWCNLRPRWGEPDCIPL